MSYWLILLAGGLNLYLGALVWAKVKRSKLNTLFVIFAHTSALLCLVDFIFRIHPTLSVVRLSYAIAAITPIFALFWVYELTKRTPPRLISWAMPVIGVYFFAISIFTDFIVEKVNYLTIMGYNGQVGSLFTLYSSFIFITISLLIYNLYIAIKSAKGINRFQYLYVLIGLLLYGSSGFFFSLFLPFAFKNYNLTMLDAPSSLFFVGFSSYAIARYRLMGIRTLVSKIYINGLIALYAYSFFYVIILIDELFFDGIYSTQSLASAPLFAIIFAGSFLPLFKRIEASSDTYFFKGHNPRTMLKDISVKLSSVLNLDELLEILLKEFQKILDADEISIFTFDEGKDSKWTCLPLRTHSFCKNIFIGNIICKEIISKKEIIVRDEANYGGKTNLVKELDRKGVAIAAPLLIRNKIIGMILLGEKMTGYSYTKEDIEFLEIISSQAAVSIENARLYEQVDGFNRTLTQKVDEQTKEIREKAEHLKKLMDMRSEFLDITSHQLRTPVTVIKGVLSMLEEGSIPPSRRKEFLRGAFEKSIKLGEIINDILRASEMDSERFELNLRPTDLNEVLKKIEEDKLRTSQSKNIVLKFRLPKTPLPPILSDEKYIEQAIVNLINNSFQYTPSGSVTVSAEVMPKAVILRVADTGIGIPKADIPKLFTKFARAENAVQTYTDGSGLGLFIIKQIVDATPGAKVEIEKTEINKGTTIALTLPIAKAS